jgi:hypothetical protein
MAEKIPLKANFTGSDATSIGEFELGDVMPVAHGGTGGATAAAARTALGLSNVDNTSDANKPVSTPQASALSPGRNLYPNGSFRVWDTNNGALSFTANGYTCAQTTMHLGTGGSPALAVTRETWAVGDVNNIYNTKHWLKAVQSAAATSTAPVPLKAYIESVLPTANKAVKVTVRAACASGTVVVTPIFLQNFGTGGSPSAAVETACSPSTITLTTTPTDFELTFTVPSISGKTLGSANNDYAAVLFRTPVSATYTTHWYNLHVGIGSGVIVPAPEGQDEDRCRRYYEIVGGSNGLDIIMSIVAVAGGNTFDIPTRFSPKRAIGTATKVGTWGVVNCGQPTARDPGLASFSYYVVATSSGIVQVYTTGGGTTYFEINCRYPV